jgi:lipopolysaccharide transport system permease protein
MSPIFFSISALPPAFQKWIYVNPLSFIIIEMRSVILWGNHPSFTGLSIYYAGSIILLLTGLTCFQKLRKGFADAL